MHSSKKSNRRRSDSLSLIKLLAKRQLTIKSMEMIFLLSEQLIAAIAAYAHQHNNDSDSLVHLNKVMAISDTAREWFPHNRPLNVKRVTHFVLGYDTYDKESLMDQIRENILSIKKRAVDCNLGTISDYLNTIIRQEMYSFIINPSHNVLFPPIDPQNEDIDVDIMGGQNPSPVSSTSDSGSF